MKLTISEWLCNAGRRATRKLVVLALVTGVLGAAWTSRANAAVSTTTVQGTVYLANGEPGSGMLHVSWPAFTTADGLAIVADSTDVTIAQDGFLSVKLAPNQGTMPGGLYYTAVFYMSDGSVSTQYWVVPAAAQATLAQVQVQVMPAAQAVQAVNKAYVDQAIAQVSQSMLTGSGGTLTGPLFLTGDPTQPLQAADKHYVDSAVSQAGSNIVTPASPGQIAYYAQNGTSVTGMSTVPLTAGGTGSATAVGALQNLGGISSTSPSTQMMSGPLILSASYDSNTTNLMQAATAQNVQNVASRSVKEFGAKGDGTFSDFKMTAGGTVVQLVDVCCGYNFSPDDVGKLISLPKVDSDGGTLYTKITSYTDSTHVTVATAASYAFDGTGTYSNQAVWATDDSPAIARAIAVVSNGLGAKQGSTRYGSGKLYFPCGMYGTSQQISVPTNMSVEGQSSGCVNILYMGTSTIDAAIEEGNVQGFTVPPSNVLRSGFYLNSSNHPEIGTCSGASCSPAVNYSTGTMKSLSVFGNKFSNWAVSILAPGSYVAETVKMYGGSTGCLYHFNDVETTFTDMVCTVDNLYGRGYPVNGIYTDGTGPGQGPIPFTLRSPNVSWATGTALVFNEVGTGSVHDAQLTTNHQDLNITSSSNNITFVGCLFEGGATGAVPDVIAGADHVFVGGTFSTGGLTISGTNNTFTNISMGKPTTITGEGNHFSQVWVTDSKASNFTNNAKSTTFTNLWSINTAAPVNNAMMTEDALGSANGAADPMVVVKGAVLLNAANTPFQFASTKFSAGTAWKAIFIGTWTNSGPQASAPPYLELTDSSPSFTFGGATITFSVNASGNFVGQTTTASSQLGFTGTVFVISRRISAGMGGSLSMSLANDLNIGQTTGSFDPTFRLVNVNGTASIKSSWSGSGLTFTLPRNLAGNGLLINNQSAQTMFYVDSQNGNVNLNCNVSGCTDSTTLTFQGYQGAAVASSISSSYNGNGMTFKIPRTTAGKGYYFQDTAGANTLLLVDSTGPVTTKNNTLDDGSGAMKATGIITGGNDTTRTTAATIATTAFASTGLVLPTVPANTTKSGRCVVLWQMSSTSYSGTFGIGMSNAPTGLWGGSLVTYAATGTQSWLAFSQTATATTAVTAATIAGTASTTYRAEFDFTLQTGASNPVTVTLYGQVNNVSATLSIQPGSVCYWLP